MSVVEAGDHVAAAGDLRTEVLSNTDRTSPSDSPLRLLPYAGVVGVFAALVMAATIRLDNWDTYFHLRYGHEFLSGNWSLRHPGSVTTFGTAHWLPTQWLPEVVMAQVQDWFGLAGIAWLAGLQFLVLAATVFLVARRHANAAISLLVLVLTIVSCVPGMSMRPQQISYILVALTTAAWLRAAERRRPPWLLVPTTYVWAMCHGMWPTGILIGLVAVVALVLDRRVTRVESLRFAAVPVLSAALTLVTPVGPGLFGAVLLVDSRGKYFSEWAPPDFTRPWCIALLVLLALAVVPRLRQGRSPWLPILLIGLAAGWSVYSLRTVPVAACMLVPFAASGLQASRASLPRAAGRGEKAAVWGAVALSLGALALAVPRTSASPPVQPSWEARALSDLPAGTVVLSDSAYGGYLMWRFPQLDLVSHGYGDAFTDAEIERNTTIASLGVGWLDDLEAVPVQYAVLDPSSELGYTLIHAEHWVVVDQSATLDLLRPPAGWPAVADRG